MPWGARLLSLWPGLARLWLRGESSSLALAISFSVLLNLVLISSLIWPEYLGSQFPLIAWPILALVWILSCWNSLRVLPQLLDVGKKVSPGDDNRIDTLFIQAQREYLKGNWIEARTMLEHRLKFRPRDAESRLLLASVLRQSQRYPAALENLTVLLGIDESRPWHFEIEREQQIIHELMQSDEPEVHSVRQLQVSPDDSILAMDPQINQIDDLSETPSKGETEETQRQRRAA